MERGVAWVPKTTVLEIIAAPARIPGHKIVVGKPATPADAPAGGYYDVGALRTCLNKYRGRNGYTGSVFVWRWEHAGKRWVDAVRGVIPKTTPKAPNGRREIGAGDNAI